MRTSTWVAIALAGSLGALAASAADLMPNKAVGSTTLRPPAPLDTRAMNTMLRADRDKDGTLSPEELEQHDIALAKRFKEVDADHDGRLTLYEFEKLLAPPEASASR